MDLSIATLREQYRSGDLTPAALMAHIRQRIKEDDPKIWIHPLSQEELAPYLQRLTEESPESLPLYGIPFAIKDNIDLAGIPTTVACPEYAYTPERSAYVVKRLIEAGAIPVGKTNLDQFATGLSGTRSPYGIPSNAFDPRYIPGGSSSGSAVAVAKGMASFSLGTDTAGSGRVPASLNNLVGFKPSRGLLSTRGLVPACRSLDCISILSLSSKDARSVLDIAAHYDEEDPFAVDFNQLPPRKTNTIGIPRRDQLEYFGDPHTERIFRLACMYLEEIGCTVKEIDIAPFREVAQLLYEGPWLAERYLALEDIFKERPEILHPVTREIIEQGNKLSAVDFFRTQYQLASLKRITDRILNDLDAVMTPTCGIVPTIQQMLNDPIRLNTQLGYYTNFMNLLNLSAVAVPVGIRPDRIPHGITFFAPAGFDRSLLDLAGQFHARTGLTMGAGDTPVPPAEKQEALTDTPATTTVVVCGAHMQGMPLNHQLTDCGAVFVEATQTAPEYRFFALNGEPPRPALVRSEHSGEAIDVEVWQMPLEAVGRFLQGIAAPLGLGRVSLKGGRESMGFIAESGALRDTIDITEFKSWRKYQESLA